MPQRPKRKEAAYLPLPPPPEPPPGQSDMDQTNRFYRSQAAGLKMDQTASNISPLMVQGEALKNAFGLTGLSGLTERGIMGRDWENPSEQDLEDTINPILALSGGGRGPTAGTIDRRRPFVHDPKKRTEYGRRSTDTKINWDAVQAKNTEPGSRSYPTQRKARLYRSPHNDALAKAEQDRQTWIKLTTAERAAADAERGAMGISATPVNPVSDFASAVKEYERVQKLMAEGSATTADLENARKAMFAHTSGSGLSPGAQRAAEEMHKIGMSRSVGTRGAGDVPPDTPGSPSPSPSGPTPAKVTVNARGEVTSTPREAQPSVKQMSLNLTQDKINNLSPEAINTIAKEWELKGDWSSPEGRQKLFNKLQYEANKLLSIAETPGLPDSTGPQPGASAVQDIPVKVTPAATTPVKKVKIERSRMIDEAAPATTTKPTTTAKPRKGKARKTKSGPDPAGDLGAGFGNIDDFFPAEPAPPPKGGSK